MVYASMMDQPRMTPLQAAEALVRGYCGWHVAPVVTETLTLDGSGRSSLFLPSLNVVSVTSVKVGGTIVDPSAYEWTADGILRRLDGTAWSFRARNVEVDLTHGHDPAEVSWIVQQIADRVTNAPDRANVLAGLTVGAKRIDLRGTAGSTGLLAMEQEALERFKIRRNP